jgi:3-keto-5-aminohexanoate cleavage enzyme
LAGRGFIVNFTPTGLIPTKDMTPHVPIDPGEIVEQVLCAAELGANMIHLHARDPRSGSPDYRKEIYADIIHGIRKKNKVLVLGVSTSGRQFVEFEQRSDVLDLGGELKPDFASLTLSSLNFNKVASINSPDMIQALARKMKSRGIRPELETFDIGMINYANYLIGKGLLPAPHYFNLILGNIACAQANMVNLGLMVRDLPPGAIWSVGGIGKYQLPMNAMAIIAGGGVRVGLEDNIWWDEDRTRLATNAELLTRILAIAKATGRAPYAQAEARRLLGV